MYKQTRLEILANHLQKICNQVSADLEKLQNIKSPEEKEALAKKLKSEIDALMLNFPLYDIDSQKKQFLCSQLNEFSQVISDILTDLLLQSTPQIIDILKYSKVSLAEKNNAARTLENKIKANIQWLKQLPVDPKNSIDNENKLAALSEYLSVAKKIQTDINKNLEKSFKDFLDQISIAIEKSKNLPIATAEMPLLKRYEDNATRMKFDIEESKNNCRSTLTGKTKKRLLTQLDIAYDAVEDILMQIKTQKKAILPSDFTHKGFFGNTSSGGIKSRQENELQWCSLRQRFINPRALKEFEIEVINNHQGKEKESETAFIIKKVNG